MDEVMIAAQDGQAPSVLIVDDDPMVRRAARRLLERTGRFGRIWEAEDAAEGVFQARRTPPDVILLDYLLPALDGANAYPFFKDSAPRAKIVAFSGALVSCPVWADAYMNKGDMERLPDLILETAGQMQVAS